MSWVPTAATTGPARYLGDADIRGMMVPGMTADLVLLGANPLDDMDSLWQLEGVMANGRRFSREALLSMLRKVIAR